MKYEIHLRTEYWGKQWESLPPMEKLAIHFGVSAAEAIDAEWEDKLAGRGLKFELVQRDGQPVDPAWFDTLRPLPEKYEELFGKPKLFGIIDADDMFDAMNQVPDELYSRIVSVVPLIDED